MTRPPQKEGLALLLDRRRECEDVLRVMPRRGHRAPQVTTTNCRVPSADQYSCGNSVWFSTRMHAICHACVFPAASFV